MLGSCRIVYAVMYNVCLVGRGSYVIPVERPLQHKLAGMCGLIQACLYSMDMQTGAHLSAETAAKQVD